MDSLSSASVAVWNLSTNIPHPSTTNLSRTTVIRSVVEFLGTYLEPVLLAMLRRRDVGVILLYHRVSPIPDPAYSPITPSAFVQHCEFIRRHFTVLPLVEFLARWRVGASLRGCCTLTFDDGYRDFIDYAYPILERYGFPATHFLVTDCLETGQPPWTYRMNVLRCEEDFEALQNMETKARERWLAERESHGIPEPPAMLRPEDLRQVRTDMVEWGSHTVSHAALHRLPLETLRDEIDRSKQQLEAILGRSVRYLAYPNGWYTPEVIKLVQEAGYDAALTVDNRPVMAGGDPYALSRFDVGGITSPMIGLEINGILSSLRKLRG
jgi:peptidoglycan/xylan/chitin deacetylase (PgdA/CDA1 family)